jgi:hypothetical protein
MALTCAECGAIDGQYIDGQHQANVKVVCHHCGKPLCDDHCVWIFDDAFSDRPALTPAGPQDIVLSAALDIFRQFGSQLRRRLMLLNLLAMSKADAEQVAYHCETCCADYHPRVILRKGARCHDRSEPDAGTPVR